MAKIHCAGPGPEDGVEGLGGGGKPFDRPRGVELSSPELAKTAIGAGQDSG